MAVLAGVDAATDCLTCAPRHRSKLNGVGWDAPKCGLVRRGGEEQDGAQWWSGEEGTRIGEPKAQPWLEVRALHNVVVSGVSDSNFTGVTNAWVGGVSKSAGV